TEQGQSRCQARAWHLEAAGPPSLGWLDGPGWGGRSLGLGQDGRAPSVTVMVFVEPLRTTVSVTVLPGFRPAISDCNVSALVTVLPSTVVTTSPPVAYCWPLTNLEPVEALRPAFAAGDPETTLVISTPAGTFSWLAASLGIVWMCTPRKARWTEP